MKLQSMDDLVSEFEKRGFHYSKEVLFNYYVSLITKPFVILTGISGSGKSKIAEIFAQIVADTDEKNYELIPVKPNWRDSKGLFGFHNLIEEHYQITPLIQLFLRALRAPNTPHFLILDEMNIAKAEHYFADYLSLIESRMAETITSDAKFNAFQFEGRKTLSDALILAAFDIGDLSTDKKVEVYRENRFVKKWRKLFSKQDNEGNWLAQVRSEFNQKDGVGVRHRLAGIMFAGSNGNYHLKDKSQLSPENAEIYDELSKLYKELTKEPNAINQDNIILHNHKHCLSADGGTGCTCTDCPYRANEKYKCDKLYQKDTDTYLVPPQLPIPLNVFTVGTVNVDETTYMFSPKILDRSNVIEFNEVDFAGLYALTEAQKAQISAVTKTVTDDSFYFKAGAPVPEFKITLPSKDAADECAKEAPEAYQTLISIFAVLKKYDMHFGYRVINEISQYIVNVFRLSDAPNRERVAMDHQILQKILPKMHGAYDQLWSPLTEMLGLFLNTPAEIHAETAQELLAILSSNTNGTVNSFRLRAADAEQCFRYPRSAMKLLTMIKDLDETGFAAFIK